jgi:hypothetical protein
MSAESRVSRTREAAYCSAMSLYTRPLGKGYADAILEMLEAVFSVESAPRLYTGNRNRIGFYLRTMTVGIQLQQKKTPVMCVKRLGAKTN